MTGTKHRGFYVTSISTYTTYVIWITPIKGLSNVLIVLGYAVLSVDRRRAWTKYRTLPLQQWRREILVTACNVHVYYTQSLCLLSNLSPFILSSLQYCGILDSSIHLFMHYH